MYKLLYAETYSIIIETNICVQYRWYFVNYIVSDFYCFTRMLVKPDILILGFILPV